MNRSFTLLLLLIAAGLAIFVATTHRWRFSTERIVQPGTPLFHFQPEDISSISIKNGDQSFRIQRKGEGWNLTKGMDDSASPEAVEALIRAALETPVLDRIDDDEIRDEKSLSSYGLLKSSLHIDFKGDAPPSLVIGKTSPDGTRQYVAFQNSKTVYLIPSKLVRLITQPVEKFRDRRLLPIDTSQVERIVFRKGDASLELQRNAGGWEILRPLKAPADGAIVEELLSKIQALRLEDFQAGIKPDTGSDSRQAPLVKAEFFTTADEAPYAIEITPSNPVTAHLEPRKISGTISSNATALFTPDLEILRDSALLLINPDYVDVIRIENGGTRRDISRTREGWSEESPNIQDLPKNLALAKVATRLPATPAELQKYGLEAPQKRITFLAKLSENTPETTAGEQVIGSLATGTPQADGSLPVLVEGTSEIRFVPGGLLQVLP